MDLELNTKIKEIVNEIRNNKNDYCDPEEENTITPDIESVIHILWEIEEYLYENSLRDPIPIPMISPAGEGSIDLFWNLNDCQLLINVKAANNGYATYAGNNKAEKEIFGRFVINKCTEYKILSEWLS